MDEPSSSPGQRRSIRLQGYDYSRAGAYFVTLCTQDRECLFGDLDAGRMHLNEPGKKIAEVWNALPDFYPGVVRDAAVVMPNHFHGIVVLQDRGDPGAGSKGPTLSLSGLVQRFKTMTTKIYSQGVKEQGWQPFRGRVWQRNFYERIVRGPEEMDRLRKYIQDNPIRWEMDPENPNLRSP